MMYNRLLDRMESKGGGAAATAPGEEKHDDARIGITAAYKAQKASANR